MKLNKIFASLAGAFLLVGAVSCTDEVKYTETPVPSGDQVYFPTNIATTLDITNNATSIAVPVERYVAGETLSVPIKGSALDANGNILEFFTFPENVTFAKGAKETLVNIGLDFSKVVPEEDYILTIELEGDQTSPYGITTAEFTAVYAPWTEWKRFGGNSDYASGTLSPFQFENPEVPVYYCEATVGAKRTKYQFGNFGCPDLEPNKEKQIPFVNEKNATIIVYEDEMYDDGTVRCDYELSFKFPDGAEANEMDFYAYVIAHPDLFNPGTEDNVKGSSFYNPQTGLFSLKTVMWGTAVNPDDPEAPYGPFDETFQLPGFKSYYINFNQAYNIVDPSGMESVVIQAIKSEDIASYAYTILPGTLGKEDVANAVAELVADTEAEQIRDNEYFITYTPEDEGDYTLVAVGYDSSNLKVYEGAFNFTFTTVKAESEWKKLGQAVYTDGFIYSAFNGIGGETWMVNVEQHKDNPGRYRIVNPYNSKFWPSGMAEWDLTGNYYITINAENPDGVYIEEGELGVKLSDQDGAITVSSLAYYYLANGYDMQEVIESGSCGKLEDGVITFPGATLLIGFANLQSWYDTNFDPDLDPYIYDKNNQPTGINPAQYESTGLFMLDLNGLEARSAKLAPAKSASSVSGQVVADKKFDSQRKFKAVRKPTMTQDYIKQQLSNGGKFVLNYKRF